MNKDCKRKYCSVLYWILIFIVLGLIASNMMNLFNLKGPSTHSFVKSIEINLLKFHEDTTPSTELKIYAAGDDRPQHVLADKVFIDYRLHQLWMTDVPGSYQPSLANLYTNGQLDYWYWREDDMKCLLEKVDPAYLDTFNALPSDRDREQVIRYYIMYHIGGVYVDLDLRLHRDVSELFPFSNCFASFSNPEETYILKMWSRQSVVSDIFACQPHHSFFHTAITMLDQYRPGDDNFRFPKLVYEKWKKTHANSSDELDILNSNYFMSTPHRHLQPGDWEELCNDPLRRRFPKAEQKCRVFRKQLFQFKQINDNVYGRHQDSGADEQTNRTMKKMSFERVLTQLSRDGINVTLNILTDIIATKPDKFPHAGHGAWRE